MQPFLRILLRGLLAGLVGGLIAGTFAYLVGEPTVEAAIAVEEAQAAAGGGHSHEEALVSRPVQKAAVFLALGLFGTAMGGLLAVAYALLRRHLRTLSDARAALGLAAAALLGAVAVPAVKYPPNPPAVGDPATVTARTMSWLMLVLLGLLAVWAAVAAHRALSRHTEAVASTGAVVAFTATVAAAYLALPAAEQAPASFPAGLLWDFRLSSLGTQAILWTSVGLLFAVAVERLHRTPTTPRERVSAA